MIFLIANSDRLLLLNVFSKIKYQLIDLFRDIQDLSISTFYQEHLISSESELSRIFPNEAEMKVICNRYPTILPENRDITIILKYHRHDEALKGIFDQVMDTYYGQNVVSKLDFVTKRLIRFGPFNSLSQFYSIQRSFFNGADLCNLKKLIPSGVLFHCIYSLISGKTLVIKSPKKDSFLINIFSAFCPNFSKSRFIFLENAEPKDIVGFSIAWVKKFAQKFNDNTSFLDLEFKTYKGDSCPPQSFLNRGIDSCIELGDDALFFIIYRNIYNVASLFFNLSSQSFVDTCERLGQHGITKYDEPILKYWWECQNCEHPIMTKNCSLYGTVLLRF